MSFFYVSSNRVSRWFNSALDLCLPSWIYSGKMLHFISENVLFARWLNLDHILSAYNFVVSKQNNLGMLVNSAPRYSQQRTPESCCARDCFVIETVYLHYQIICRIPLQHFLPLFPSHVFSFSFLSSALTFLHEYLCASKWPAFASYFSRRRPPFRVAQLPCTFAFSLISHHVFISWHFLMWHVVQIIFLYPAWSVFDLITSSMT